MKKASSPTTLQSGLKTIRIDARDVSYLAGLDGLRALAVLAVLLFHANTSWLPGGFLGVEVFFVLSGFLITRGLLAEWRSTARLDLKSFWRRRALRLLPALFLLLATLLTVISIVEPENLSRLRGESLAALGYVTNWFLIFDNHSYFDTWEKPSLLGHLWSLAIEEQFYLLWPVVMAVGLRCLRAPVFVMAILVAAGASYGAMTLLAGPTGFESSRAYYGTDTRIGALLLGSALAFLPIARAAHLGQTQRRSLAAAGVASLAVLATLAYVLDQDHALLYRGGFAFTSLATVVLIASLTETGSPVARLLSLSPLRWLGARSYGIYLWHWPIFLVLWPQSAGLGQFLLLSGISIAAAAISYTLLEMPVRQGAIGRAWQGMGAARLRGLRPLASGLAIVLAVSFVTALWAITGPRSGQETPDYFAQSSVRLASPSQSVTIFEVASLGAINPAPSVSIPLLPASRSSCLGSDGNIISWGSAGCGRALAETADVEIATGWSPHTTPALPAPRLLETRWSGPVTAIGDSVMLGAAYALFDKFPDIRIDAEVSRSPIAAISLLRTLAAGDQLQPTIIIHIGTNGVFSRAQFEEIMAIAGPERDVFFLNLKVPRPWEGPNNEMLLAATADYSNAFLIDWSAASSTRPELFWRDQIHLVREGTLFYADLVAAALAE